MAESIRISWYAETEIMFHLEPKLPSSNERVSNHFVPQHMNAANASCVSLSIEYVDGAGKLCLHNCTCNFLGNFVTGGHMQFFPRTHAYIDRVHLTEVPNSCPLYMHASVYGEARNSCELCMLALVYLCWTRIVSVSRIPAVS